MIPPEMFDQFEDSFFQLLGLRSIQDVAFDSDALGASRLLTCPFKEPPEALTLVFSGNSLQAHLAIGGENAMELIACGETTTDLDVDTSAEVDPSLVPKPFSSWATISAIIRNTGDCMSDNAEKGSHFHYAFGPGEDSRYAWFNPRDDEHQGQCTLIDAYRKIRDQMLRQLT